MDQQHEGLQVEDLEKVKRIDYGSGVVYKALEKKTGKTVIVKMAPELDNLKGTMGTTLREMSCLMKMKHENIIRLEGVVNIQNNNALVFEYMHQDLREHMKSPEFSMKSVKPYERLIMHTFENGYHLPKAFYDCNVSSADSHTIIHRDLKPASLLIDATTSTLKIANFESARAYIPVMKFTDMVGTQYYKPPELLLGLGNYSTPLDVWAVGCIFAEMVNKRVLFEGTSEIDQLYKIFSIMGYPTYETWPELPEGIFSVTINPKGLKTVVPDLESAGVDLLTKMLCLDPSQRITASAALKHEYFNDMTVQ